MICDACNVRPEWKGEHRCHTPEAPAEMLVGGVRFFGRCDCAVMGACKPPTAEEIKAMRESMKVD